VNSVGQEVARWGRLDVLLNLDLSVFLETMETNLYAKLRLTQALFPLLKMNDCARIVNLSSGLG
jgi:short-subunit dehydrogenase involved in D-alanine esterification of teichoic acids